MYPESMRAGDGGGPGDGGGETGTHTGRPTREGPLQVIENSTENPKSLIQCSFTNFLTNKMLTQNRLKQVLHYEPLTGMFTWLVSGNGRNIGAEAGSVVKARNELKYQTISVDGKTYFAHRLAFLYMTGLFPVNVVNHIDGDGLNNVWLNLEDVTQAVNLQSDNIVSRSKSGVRGVYWNPKAQRWQANYVRDGVRYYIGLFDELRNAEQAIADHKAGRPVKSDHVKYRHR